MMELEQQLGLVVEQHAVVAERFVDEKAAEPVERLLAELEPALAV